MGAGQRVDGEGRWAVGGGRWVREDVAKDDERWTGYEGG